MSKRIYSEMEISGEFGRMLLSNDWVKVDGTTYTCEDTGMTLTLIKDGDWIDDGKYDYRTLIWQDTKTFKYWSISESRSGSYYSDYYYDSEDASSFTLSEVYPVEVVVTQWNSVMAV